MTVAVGDIAVAGLEFGTTLRELLVGQLHVDRTIRNIDVDHVSVLDERDRTLVRGLRRHMADGQA